MDTGRNVRMIEKRNIHAVVTGYLMRMAIERFAKALLI
jgi:hypothetical protein